MKLKDGFLLREVAGQIVVLPTGEDLDPNMMITLNSTARFLWERMEQENFAWWISRIGRAYGKYDMDVKLYTDVVGRIHVLVCE